MEMALLANVAKEAHRQAMAAETGSAGCLWPYPPFTKADDRIYAAIANAVAKALPSPTGDGGVSAEFLASAWRWRVTYQGTRVSRRERDEAIRDLIEAIDAARAEMDGRVDLARDEVDRFATLDFTPDPAAPHLGETIAAALGIAREQTKQQEKRCSRAEHLGTHEEKASDELWTSGSCR